MQSQDMRVQLARVGSASPLVKQGLPNRHPRRGPLLSKRSLVSRADLKCALNECKALIRFLRDLEPLKFSTDVKSIRAIALPLLSRVHELISYLTVHWETSKLDQTGIGVLPHIR